MEIIISNNLIIKNASNSLQKEVKQQLTIQNPAYLEKLKMRRWLGKTQKQLHHYTEIVSGLTAPRGFFPQLIGMAKRAGEKVQFVDNTRTLPEADFQFHGELKPFQQKAVDEMPSRDMGTLAAPTGGGKTIMAISMIAERKQPTLIVAHAKELLNQWIDRIETFLGIPRDDIGMIGGGRKKVGKQITVALVQSLYKCASEVAPHIGFLIVDEAHRTPSRTFTEAVSAFDCKYILGLSATPWRRDGLSKLIFWYVGDVVHEVNKASLVESGDVLRAEIVPRETTFESSFNAVKEYSKMLSELTQDPVRNRLIVNDVAKEARNGPGACVVLTDRKTHCSAFQGLLQRKGVKAEVLTGDTPDLERKAIVDSLNKGRVKVLIATGQLIGEGFDCKELSTLFLTTPIKFDGRVLQYLGRVLRPAPGKKKARVFDYVDVHVGVLKAAAAARRRVYGSC